MEGGREVKVPGRLRRSKGMQSGGGSYDEVNLGRGGLVGNYPNLEWLLKCFIEEKVVQKP